MAQFSFLRLVTVILSNGKVLRAMRKAWDGGTAHTFVSDGEEAIGASRNGYFEGYELADADAYRDAANAQSAAWDVIEAVNDFSRERVRKVIICDEYLPYKKNGKFDHDRLSRIYLNLDGNGEIIR